MSLTYNMEAEVKSYFLRLQRLHDSWGLSLRRLALGGSFFGCGSGIRDLGLVGTTEIQIKESYETEIEAQVAFECRDIRLPCLVST